MTAFGYDDKSGRLTSVTQPQVPDHLGVKTSPVTKYGYDPYGNLTSITDALGRVTTFTFNAYGQQKSRTLPYDLTTSKATEEKFYNGFGDLDYTVDFNGAKVDSVYDYEDAKYGTKLGRLMGILDQFGQPLETYEYDGYGRRSKVTQAGGDVYGYGYDAEGRLTQETMPAGTISYGYDQTTGWHTSTESANTHVNYGYDAFGRLTSVEVTKRGGAALTPSEVTQYEYTPAGNVETVEVKSGSVTLRSSEYRYDAERPWVEWLTHQAAKTVPDPVDPNQTVTELRPASQFVYQRTADGQIAKVVESVAQPVGEFDLTTAVYTYDALNRLTKEATATTAAVPPSTSRTVSYTLDVVGNRRRETTNDNGTVTVTDGTFNVRDQLTGQVTTIGGTPVGSTTFTYDLNGAETKRVSGNGDTTDSKWTVLGRLGDVTVTVVGGDPTTVHYSYNPDGIRTAATVTAGGPAETTRHLVDSVNPTGYQQDLELRAGDGALLETIVIGLELLSRTGHDTDGPTAYPQLTTYLLTDVHSGVRQRAGLVGVVAATRFAAFGEIAGRAYWSGNVAHDVNGHLYRGEYTDAVTGAVYLRQRWYDLATGRLSCMDPIGIRATDRNLYRYANGNPISFVDPSGLEFSIPSLNVTIDGHFTDTWTRTPGMVHTLVTVQRSSKAIRIVSGILLSGIALLGVAAVTDMLLSVIAQPYPVQSTTANAQNSLTDGCQPQYIYESLDSLGRAQGAFARFSAPQLRAPGQYAGFTSFPSWWHRTNLPTPVIEDVSDIWRRGHMIASSLGGAGGTTFENMVPLYVRVNYPEMYTTIERNAADAARAGGCVSYLVIPSYAGPNYYPSNVAVLMSVNGTVSEAVDIQNSPT